MPRDEFRAKIRAVLEEHRERGWVVDGSYSGKVGDIVDEQATDIICV
jgi:hypothetical protein